MRLKSAWFAVALLAPSAASAQSTGPLSGGWLLGAPVSLWGGPAPEAKSPPCYLVGGGRSGPPRPCPAAEPTPSPTHR